MSQEQDLSSKDMNPLKSEFCSKFVILIRSFQLLNLMTALMKGITTPFIPYLGTSKLFQVLSFSKIHSRLDC